MIKGKLDRVRVFSQKFTGTQQYITDYPNTTFVLYDDYRYLERKYLELLKQVR